MSSNYQDPDGDSMDDMNQLKERIRIEEELYRQSIRMVYDTGLGRLYLPTLDHVKVLVKRIEALEEQIKLGVANGDIKEEPPY